MPRPEKTPITPTEMRVCANLLQAFLESGLSIDEAAINAGVTCKTFQKYLKAESRPKLDKLFAICSKLDWPFDAILGLPHNLPRKPYGRNAAERIQTLLLEEDESFAQMGAKTKVSSDRVRIYTKGKIKPPLEFMIRLCRAYGVSAKYMMEER